MSVTANRRPLTQGCQLQPTGRPYKAERPHLCTHIWKGVRGGGGIRFKYNPVKLSGLWVITRRDVSALHIGPSSRVKMSKNPTISHRTPLPANFDTFFILRY
jgi:hypothetical protein